MADSVYDRLVKILDTNFGYVEEEPATDIAEKIKSAGLLREESEPCWIPVSEQLPQIGYEVIVAGQMKYRWEKEYFHFVDAALFTDEEIFVTFNDWYEGQDEFMITHWMPLPEMPKEDLSWPRK
jgi:hypothetical protein